MPPASSRRAERATRWARRRVARMALVELAAVEIVTSQGSFGADVAGPEGGPTVLLLHGFPQDHREFDPILPRLHAAGLRTYALDQRGYSRRKTRQSGCLCASQIRRRLRASNIWL